MKKILNWCGIVLIGVGIFGGLFSLVNYTRPVMYMAHDTLEYSVSRTIDSVVHITNDTMGWQGSGVAITEDIIMTARHVVEGGISFTVTTNDGRVFFAKTAVSSKKYDLGFIKLDNLKWQHELGLSPAEFGSIEDCRLGRSVYVIGSPYGKLNFNSVTLGIISGLNRDCDELNSWEGDYGWSIAFTTDSAGHPGNSGCPVFTTDGVVRGILVGGHSPVLIYCMPVDLVVEDMNLIKNMFIQDKYKFEEVEEVNTDWSYRIIGPGLGE